MRGRPLKHIAANGLGAIGWGYDPVSPSRSATLSAKVADGPVDMIAREITVRLRPEDLGWLLRSVADKYPDLLLGIADAIREADRLEAEADSPYRRMAWKRAGVGLAGHERQRLIRERCDLV